MAVAEESGRSFEYTATWVVSLVCFTIVFISVAAERALNRLGKFFKRKNQEALFGALQKLKEELMLLGFISLLLTVFQGLISNICIPENVASVMLPCKMETAHRGRRLLAEEVPQSCSEGHVPFLSREALHQLHIFIFVLAVVYVVFCATTMVLGGLKIREWRHWEHLIQREISQHPKAHTARIHFKEFRERAGRYWRKFRVLSWAISFFKQFYGSVTKSDYIALRSGFIHSHCPGNPNYDFHKYLLRTLEHDFRKIVGISWYLWLFVMIFLLMNIAGWHTYFWLSFLPLILLRNRGDKVDKLVIDPVERSFEVSKWVTGAFQLLLIVGAKLEHIITELAKEASQKAGDPETLVRPSDELFWFHRPTLVLYLIHFILFQNSFEIAFFLWIWSTYGIRSCIMEELGLIIPRLIVGVIVQVLCSYSTLPLYALVSQMGSMFKPSLFDESTKDLVMTWVKDRKTSSSSHGNMNRLVSDSTDPVIVAQLPTAEEEITASHIEMSAINISQIQTWNQL